MTLIHFLLEIIFPFLEPDFVRFGGREVFFSIRFLSFRSRLDQRGRRQNEIKCDINLSGKQGVRRRF